MALEHESYPVVLMDCQMPELDGYGAAREIRRREAEGHRIPLIAVTAHAFEGERQKAISAGMDDYVTKPINAQVLNAAIERWWPKPIGNEPESGERLASLSEGAAPPEEASVLNPSVKRSDAVAKVFLKHVPDQLIAIGAAVRAVDATALKAAAHKLKGSCLAVGVPRMAELCAKLEEVEGDNPALFAELQAVFGKAQRELLAQLEGKTKSAAS
jgi:CheY-like chemotaxis protein